MTSKETVRTRCLITIAILLMALTTVVNCWPFRVEESPNPSTRKLRLEFLGYTNSAAQRLTATIRITNQSRDSMSLHWSGMIWYDNQARNADSFEITNSLALLPGCNRDICFPAPTNGLRWKAVIGCVESKEIDRKEWLSGHLPRWGFLRKITASYLIVRLHYAHGEWLGPPSQ